jgi:hypothetical protein
MLNLPSRSYPWAKTFTPSDASAALAGDTRHLLSAFIWCLTPEGELYWLDRYRSGLTIRARYRLRSMLHTHRRRTKP